MFHWMDGWCFERKLDGSVVIYKTNGKFPGDAGVVIENQSNPIPVAEWASIVASVSRCGETFDRWAFFQKWHEDGPV